MYTIKQKNRCLHKRKRENIGGISMLDSVNMKSTVTKEEFKKQAKKLEKELETLPQHIKEARIPVIILFEGWGAAGKGRFPPPPPRKTTSGTLPCGGTGRTCRNRGSCPFWIEAGIRMSPSPGWKTTCPTRKTCIG